MEGAFYEVGALYALQEAVPGLELHRLHVYVGVSSGAIIASCLAAGIPVSTLLGAVGGSAGPEFELGPGTLFRPDWREFSARLSGAPQATLRALRAWIEEGQNGGDALASLASIIPAGLFDHAPIERFVSRVLETAGVPNRFAALPAPLRVIAVDVDTARTAVFGSPPLDQVPVSRAVQASTALPVMYRPVEIDGRSYIDGVATRTLHASLALDAGADLVLCVNPIVPVDLGTPHDGPPGPGPTHLADAGLPFVLSQTFRTLVHSRMETGFRRYRHTHPGTDTLLVEPRLEERALFFSNIFSFANRRAVCEQAYQGTRAWLRSEADAVDGVLSRHGLALDRDSLAGPGTVLFAERPGPTVDRLSEALDRLEGLLKTL